MRMLYATCCFLWLHMCTHCKKKKKVLSFNLKLRIAKSIATWLLGLKAADSVTTVVTESRWCYDFFFPSFIPSWKSEYV